MPHSDTPSERPSSQEPVLAGGQVWFKFSDVWNTRWVVHGNIVGVWEHDLIPNETSYAISLFASDRRP